MKKSFLPILVASFLAVDLCGGKVFAASNQNDNNLDSYDLPTQVVKNTKVDSKKKNPYLTGGDVSVITAKQIKEHHFTDITKALQTIPGVIVQSAGYRGGEYGYNDYNTQISINGESNITVLINGVPVNNGISSRTGNAQSIDFQTLPNINDIEKIEVIKGAGSAIYGSSSSGGVINIVTKTGTRKPKTTLNISTGSFNHHKYMITQSGSSKDNSLRYVFSLGEERSGDTKYKDPFTKKTLTYDNTRYENKTAYLDIVKDFDKKHNVEIMFNHINSTDHYPITAPDTRYLKSFYDSTMAPINIEKKRYEGLNNKVPGYRNIFLYDAWLGSYDKTLSNNINIKYTFDKTKSGLSSYISIYKNYTHYYTRDYSGIWNVPYKYYEEMKPYAYQNGVNSHTDIEKVIGARLQLSKDIKNQSLTGGIDFSKSSYSYNDNDPNNNGTSTRKQYYLFLQDKIKMSKKFNLTPGLNYAVYSGGTYRGNFGGNDKFDSAKKLTYSLYGQYLFDKNSDFYFGVSQIFRPVSAANASKAYEKLNDEVGYNYSLGVNHRFDRNNKLSISYNDIDMKNTIAKYSILVNDAWKNKTINAKRKKRAMNISYEHRFNKYLKGNLSYSWINEHYNAKNNVINPDGTTADQLINKYRPRNIYRMDLNYTKDKLNALLDYTVYSGNDTEYFSAKKFGVCNLAINYKIDKKMTAYLTVNNLFNESYQTYGSSYSGVGSYPQESRSFMLGINYTF